MLVSLAGKAAVELYSETSASGCSNDIKHAINIIREDVSENASCGLGMIAFENMNFDISENMNSRNEIVILAELERYMIKTKDILLKNRDFLEKVTETLIKKETLLYSDIQAIRNSTIITEVAV